MESNQNLVNIMNVLNWDIRFYQYYYDMHVDSNGSNIHICTIVLVAIQHSVFNFFLKLPKNEKKIKLKKL